MRSETKKEMNDLSDYLLCTRGLTKRFGHHHAVDHVDLHIPKGAIYGFIGRNGAGKTTCLKMISGLSKPTEGEIEIFGYSGRELEHMRSRIGCLIEAPGLYENMTAYENLKTKCLFCGIHKKGYIEDILETVGLGDTGKKKAKHFSLGMKQRLGIAIALAGNPDFLILDEPVNGLDPQGIIEVRELILKLNREKGITFLISSHILDELSRLATHYGFIDSGHMVKEMSAAELDAACRKCIRVQVSDVRALSRVLDEINLEYSILSDTMADIFAKINISQLALALADQGCDIISLDEREESLESYYVNLIGGGNRNE